MTLICWNHLIKASTAYWRHKCKCSNCRFYKYETDRQYREQNKEKLKLKRQQNKEKVRQWKLADYKRHRDAYIARSRNLQKTEKYKSMHKSIKLKNRYNLTIEDRNEMFNKQNGLCAICFINKAIYIDHDHVTGKVRALLCRGCNLGIGFLKDNVTILTSAANYLTLHSNVGSKI